MPRITFAGMTLNALPTDFVQTRLPAGAETTFEVRERSGANVAEFVYPAAASRSGANMSSRTVWEWRGAESGPQELAASFVVANAGTGQLAVNLVARSNGTDAAEDSGYVLVFRPDEGRLLLYMIDRVLGGEEELADSGAESAVADGAYVMAFSVSEEGAGTRCVASVSTSAGALVASLNVLDEGSDRPLVGFAGVSSGQFNTTTIANPTVWFTQLDINYVPVALANAGDRLRSSLSETTGSLLEAVDVRAVDASVSEAYTYAQRLEAATLTSFREVLRERDSTEVDFAYYPRPRQNVAMENQYSGVTLLSRLSTYYPPRVFDAVDDTGLGIVTSGTATASQIVAYVLALWAADADWFEYETVPDLRVRMPGLNAPSDYTTGVGVATSSVVSIPQDGNARKDALTILRELLSPFPGTIVRQNSSGKLEIVPAYGPDADATPALTLGTRDLYTVSIGEPDPFSIVNRATVTSTGFERSEDVELMQPAWFQVGGVVQFGNDQWYDPPVDRVNLQWFTSDTASTRQETLSPTDSFEKQRPTYWKISSDALPAGEGISLVDSDDNPMVTLAWKRLFGDSLVDSGTNGLTIVTPVIPFTGETVTAFRFAATIGGEPVGIDITAKWFDEFNGIALRFADYNLETDRTTGTNGVIVEFTLNDASAAYTATGTTSGTFGFLENGDTLPADSTSGNAITDSQTEYGILERTINIQGYVFDALQLEQIARAYVLQNITPKVVRELDVAALSGYRLTFDTIGRTVQLPNGEIGKVTGVQYSDDFVANSVRKTATVEVANPLGAGAIPALTLYHLAEDGSYWLSEAGGTIEREEGTAASPLAGGGTGGDTTPGTETPVGSSSTSSSLVTYPKTTATTTGDWYVDPTSGDDGNAGTSTGAAFETLGAALAAASDGDTILVRSGTLRPTSRYSRTTNWATGINVWNYGTERPIIDASALGGGSAGRVIRLAGTREHWKGFEVINSADIPVYIEGSENTVEDLWVHDNAREAIYIYGSGAEDNIVQDCIVWRNGLVSDGGTNAPDGIVCTANPGSITNGHAIVRCFVANASDDAFDLFRGNGCLIWDCVAFEAGLHHSAGNQGGDGNGFKAGGADAGVGNNTIRGSLAVNCRVQGFEPNLAPVACTFEFNTATGNQYGFGLGTEGHSFDSNLAFGNAALNVWSGSATETLNSWNLGTGDPLFVNPSGFDWSLAAGSPAIGEGTGGENLGASDVAVELALDWCGVV